MDSSQRVAFVDPLYVLLRLIGLTLVRLCRMVSILATRFLYTLLFWGEVVHIPKPGKVPGHAMAKCLRALPDWGTFETTK